MRLLFALSLACAATTAASAQELRALPSDAPLPPVIEASLTSQLEEGGILDLVLRWEGNLVGDATADQLVQAAFGVRGGNGIWLQHYVFIGAGDSFSSFFPLALDGGIMSAAIEGPDLVVTLSTYLDSDPRCCPSGVEVVRLPLN